MDGRLGRNLLKGALGDALHAVLCGAGHNLRLLIRKLLPFCARIRAVLLAMMDALGRESTTLLAHAAMVDVLKI